MTDRFPKNTRWLREIADELVGELKGAAGRLLSQSPELIDELKTVARHPRRLRFLLDRHVPRLSRRFLGAASNWTEPFTIGMGFRVEKLGEDAVEVRMPGGWRNQGDGGVVHSSALSALGEFAVRLYWESHLDLRHAGAQSSRVQVRVLSRPVGAMRGVFRLPVADREAILHRLRADNRADIETQTRIYDRDGRLVAEVDVDWQLSRQLALGSGFQKDS